MKLLDNQKGMFPIIYILAALVIAAFFGVIFFQFSNKSDNKQPSPPNTASLTIPAADKDCADRDYTGCDGVEVVKWTDDGKR